MAKNATGIDVGSGTAVAVQGRLEKGSFRLTGFSVEQNPGGSLESGWEAMDLPFKPGPMRVALSGKELNVRYTRVPSVPDWQLRRLMRFEVAEVGDTSGTEVASDFNLLPTPPEADGEDIVLLAMARTSLLDQHQAGIEAGGFTLECYTPAAIGLYNAFLRHGVVQDDTVLLANIGRESVDVVIMRGPDLVFARNQSGGARLFEDAVSQQLGIKGEQATRLVREFADLRPSAQHATPNHEKVSTACSAAAGQLVSLLQSSVLFCKTQVKLSTLKLDRVLICGGASSMDGLSEALAAGLSVPVQAFDPWPLVDASGLSPEEANALAEYGAEAVVALGLATMATDSDAYGLEIVPPDVARKREFMGRKLWLIGAGVLAVAYLGFFVQQATSEASDLKAAERVLRSQVSSKQRTDSETRDLLASNADLSLDALTLQRIVGTGEQMARTLEFLGSQMPPDFWITRMEGRWGVDEELAIHDKVPRPLVLLKGSLRQGAQAPIGQYQSMVEGISESLPGVQSNQSFDRDRYSIDISTFGDPPTLELNAESGEDN
ncbi:MAG: pilus assembly protein PilM [Planctomycetota bacterium]|nr:pilus assembly protein PilM [Planctomycetota bacterium]